MPVKVIINPSNFIKVSVSLKNIIASNDAVVAARIGPNTEGVRAGPYLTARKKDRTPTVIDIPAATPKIVPSGFVIMSVILKGKNIAIIIIASIASTIVSSMKAVSPIYLTPSLRRNREAPKPKPVIIESIRYTSSIYHNKVGI
jgi:hypothetical protein